MCLTCGKIVMPQNHKQLQFKIIFEMYNNLAKTEDCIYIIAMF